MAQRVAVPVGNLVEVHPKLSDEAACLAHLLAVAVHAAQATRIEGRPYVTVLGDCPLALLLAQHMTRLNASVRVLGEHPARFTLCERWGIKHRHVMEAGRRHDQDVVIESTGLASMYEAAFGLLRPRGKLVALAGASGSDDDRGANGVKMLPGIEAEVEILGISDATGSGTLSTAAAILERGEVDVSPFVGQMYKLEQAEEAFRVASAPGASCVLMHMPSA